jgi:hypothetical protein
MPALERGELSRDAQPLRLGAGLGVGIPHVIAPVAAVVPEVMLVIGIGAGPALGHVAADLAAIRAALPSVPPHLRAIARLLTGALGQFSPEQVAQPGVHGSQSACVHRGASPIEVREHAFQRGHVPPVIHALARVLTQLTVILGALGAVACGLAMSGTATKEEGEHKN